MTLRRPSRTDLAELGNRYHLQLSDQELDDFVELTAGVLAGYDELDQLPDPARPVVPAIRDPGGRPTRAEDPLNAVVRRCSVRSPGDASGPLRGRSVGIKDTICIAGVPMTCGSRLLFDYTPEIDATVVRRILLAGGHITAVLNTDDFAFSGCGHTSAYGPTLHPADPSRAPGGSSCGSAVAVATGIVDVALGGDQGGSIRIPAAWTGIVGLKPTHGLVPYTGIVGFDQTIDHVGPMARTTADCALLLEVIAGRDDTCLDPRQPADVPVQRYRSALTENVKGMRIGLVREGFGTPESLAEVDEAVMKAADRFARLGAVVTEVSVPEHRNVLPIWNAIAIEGGIDAFYNGHAAYQHKGWYNARLISAMSRAIATHGADFSPTAKMGALVAHYMRERYHGVFYARAQNLARALTAAYDRVLTQHDLLLMPTTPQTAHRLPPSPEQDRKEYVRRALDMVRNTAAFDLTGHPSISVPCRGTGGLPIGLMLTGRHFDDAACLRAAHAYEGA